MPLQDVPPSSDGFVRSFAKGLAVIRTFRAEAPEQTLSEVAARTGLTRAGARRILLTLVALGYVVQQGRHFRPTAKILDLGFSYLSTLPLDGTVEIVGRTARAAEAPCAISVRDGLDMVVVMQGGLAFGTRWPVGPGHRRPLFWTSMGRVVLAALPDEEIERLYASVVTFPNTPKTLRDPVDIMSAIARVRADGFAEVDGELLPDLHALSVPIRSPDGAVYAALTLGGKGGRIDDTNRPNLLGLLTAARREIEAVLGTPVKKSGTYG